VRLFRLSLCVATAFWIVTTLGTSSVHAADGPIIDLKVLVVTDGGAPVEAIRTQLASEGIPVTTVDLKNPNRPTITDLFLADEVPGAAQRAKYQAVVLPNENPFGNAAELKALADYEKKFGIRQVDAYSWASPAVGLNYPGYSGALDGAQATATAAGLAGPLRYLRGPVTFEDNSPTVDESYGFPAAPLADDPATNSHFEPFLTTPMPNGEGTGVLAGVYTHDGRSELVLTFAYNSAQHQFRLLAHGIVTWMTKGIHLGYNRNYFALHVDDIFLPDARWSTVAHCTPGEDCPAAAPGQPEITTPDIRMTPADVTFAVDWQKRHGFTMDMMYNGGGSEQAIAQNGSDPLTTAALANKGSFRWVNHTFEHPFLGCKQDYSVRPWRCAKDALGNVQYASKADIVYQINQNKAWANRNGLSIQANEVVTGEHSGFFLVPQQPKDNPNLGPAFTQTGIAWAGSDNSRDPAQRKVGSALTVPRHPMNIFFNVATAEEETREYNWIYTSRANGGSGICEDNPGTTTCIQPLDPQSGFRDYIVPLETRIALSHIVNNDPRPHYVHQSNITEDRIIYPLLESVFSRYKSLFAANTPAVNLRMSAIGTQLKRESAWRNAVNNGTARAQLRDGVVTVTGPPGLDIPLTMPEGTRKNTTLSSSVFGTPYAGERSAYERTTAVKPTLTLTLPPGATT
jgi:hypothetical protein